MAGPVVAAKESIMPIRMAGRFIRSASRTCEISRSTSSTICRDCRCSVTPAGVSRYGLRDRSSTRMPSVLSICEIVCDTADCVTFKAWAAADRLSADATAAKMRSMRMSRLESFFSAPMVSPIKDAKNAGTQGQKIRPT